MTQTTVNFYTEPTNMDYLMPFVRLGFGDLTGAIYSDTMIRTSLVSGIMFLQLKWNGKYQIHNHANALSPQPLDVASGYKRYNSLHGQLDLPDVLTEGSIFRDPYLQFTAANPPLIEPTDEEAIKLAAVYALRRAQVSSNTGDFISWKTEDIQYSNLGAERSFSRLLETDLMALNDYIRTKIARPTRSEFPIAAIPAIPLFYL